MAQLVSAAGSYPVGPQFKSGFRNLECYLKGSLEQPALGCSEVFVQLDVKEVVAVKTLCGFSSNSNALYPSLTMG